MTAREINMELRGLAMNLQQQQQSIGMMMQQLAQRIQQMEMQLQSMGQAGMNPNMQQRPWNTPMQGQQGMGSGFLGNVVTGLGLGAGFAVADNIVDDIFDSF
jgi:tetrahydromethanopterin S-methyltransferase subunit B